MTSYRRYKIWSIILFLSAAALFFLPAAFKASAEEDYVAEVGEGKYEEFDEALSAWTAETPLKLLADVECETISVDDTQTLDLNGHTLSHKTGDGSVITVRGALTLCGGGEIRGGSGTSTRGGGIDVIGELILRDEIYVTDNEGSNICLSNNNTVNAENFTGRAGITVFSPATRETPVANGTGEFFSDDALYEVKKESGKYSLVLSPLTYVEVTFEQGDTRIFPTTELAALKQLITNITYLNGNHVPYLDEVNEYALSGALTVGTSEVTLTATAKKGGTAVTTFEVEVVAPAFERITEFAYSQKSDTPVYFDSDLETLYKVMSFTVKGEYEDGKEREILRAFEIPAESYIADYYVIDCDLSAHTDGTARGTLYVFGAEGTELAAEEFPVRISKYVTELSSIAVEDVIYLEKSGGLDPYAFTPDLKQGITPIPTVDGAPFEANSLDFGIYTVTVSFAVNDTKNFEPITGTKEVRLFVYAREYAVEAGGVTYVITRAGGISPEWRFTVKDITKSVKLRLGNERKLVQAIEVTFMPEGSKDIPDEFEIKVHFSEQLLENKLAVIRILEDGTTAEQSSELGDGYLAFFAGDLLEARFVVTESSHMWLYLILAICFGVLCAVGAGVLLWYIFIKRKII